MIEILTIVLFSLLTLHKSLGFYFWHDDFSIIYTARTGECVFGWPYTAYCSLFPFLDKFFNYNSFYYFSFGILLAIFANISFYFFLKNQFPKKVALFVCLIFASVLIGQASFFEAYSVITTFLSLGFLFITLNFFAKSNRLIIGYITFFLSILALEARSATYGIAAILVIWFLNKTFSVRKKIFITIFTLLFHTIVYFLGFLINKNNLVQAPLSNYAWVRQTNLLEEISHFLQNVSTIFIPDQIYKLLIQNFKDNQIDVLFLGFGILMLLALALSLKDQDRTQLKTKLFSIFLTSVLYLPYGLISNQRLDSIHRYLIFILPAIVIGFGTFYKLRYWSYVAFTLVFAGILQTNIVFKKHEEFSRDMFNFYTQLHTLAPSVTEYSAFYFLFDPKVNAKAGDYLRVGHESSEAALGTEFKIKHSKLKLVDTETELNEYFKRGYKIYRFSYDGVTLKKN